MNGVEILNQYQVAGDPVWNNEAAAITFLLCFGVLTLMGIIISIYEKDPFYAVETSLVGIVFGFLFSMIDVIKKLTKIIVNNKTMLIPKPCDSV
jgi:hypothetical protein